MTIKNKRLSIVTNKNGLNFSQDQSTSKLNDKTAILKNSKKVKNLLPIILEVFRGLAFQLGRFLFEIYVKKWWENIMILGSYA